MSEIENLWDFISDTRINKGLSHEELMAMRRSDWRREYIDKTHRESLKHAFNSGKPWSEGDNQILGMEHITMKERARLLGRSYHSVRSQHAKLRRGGVL